MNGRPNLPNAAVRAVMVALPSRYLQQVYPDRFEGGEIPIGSINERQVQSFTRFTIWRAVRAGWLKRSPHNSSIIEITESGFSIAPEFENISVNEEFVDFKTLHA